MNKFDIWYNAKILAMSDHALPDTLVVGEGKIEWLGMQKNIPNDYERRSCFHDSKGLWITPGLIDCHTHLIYANNRLPEFVLRQQGMRYEEILQQGLGIFSTVDATRKASYNELYTQSAKRLVAFLEEGVTTIEIKSGYGLDFETERKILQVAKQLESAFPVKIQKTYLGAHVLPKEYNSSQAYIKDIIHSILPKLIEEKLIDGIDSFCETVAFSPEELAVLYSASKQYHLNIHCHAEQLSNTQGAQLAARYHAHAVSHLEYLDEAGVKALKAANSVAVLLPGAYYFLKQNHPPPIELLRKYAIPMAIATDCNPGTSPTTSLLLMMNMACVIFGLTPYESLQAVTINAAKALRLERHKGKLAVGYDADFVLWDISDPAELAYQFGSNPCYQVIKNGNRVYEKNSSI